MVCSRCTSIPEIHHRSCNVYLNCNADSLFDKTKKIIQKYFDVYKEEEQCLKFKVSNFKKFIKKLSLEDGLSSKEKKEINILPLEKEEILDFSSFLDTKSLYSWNSLIDSEDLIYILQNNSILTYFQPIVDIKNKSIYGYELLSRGLKKDGSIMSPFEMLALARESKLNFNLDRQFREMGITNAAKNKIDKKLFINFLPNVIYDPKVCLKTTVELINKYNLDPSQITFEVVETEDIADTDHLTNILDFYREKGFNIALDDVGSGYSSLNNLAKLKPDYIKIDMEIVRDIHKNKLKQAIFESLINMIKNTDIFALAEGVETREELEYVVQNGVDLVQGFYFGKPCEEPLLELQMEKCVI